MMEQQREPRAKARRNEKKFTDRHWQLYKQSDTLRARKGINYKEEALYRVDFKPNEDAEDIYDFKELPPCKQFQQLFEGDNSQAATMVHRNIRNYFMHNRQDVSPTPIQSVAMPYVLKADYDVLVRAEAGCGKTLAYAVPIVYNVAKAKRQATERQQKEAIYALVVVPTDQLCTQICKIFEELCKGTDVVAYFSCVGADLKQIRDKKRTTGINILICDVPHLEHYFLDPEDINEQNNDKWNVDHLQYVVLDEAPQLIGSAVAKTTFYNYIQPLSINLMLAQEPIEEKYRLIMVASQPDITQYADFPFRRHGCVYVELGDTEFPAHSIQQRFVLVENDWDETDRLNSLVKLMRGLVVGEEVPEEESKQVDLTKAVIPRTIIFVNGPESANEIRTTLVSHFPPNACTVVNKAEGVISQIHGINYFKSDTAQILIATDETAHGMDFVDVKYVINYELPMDPNDFAPRIGRCGRLGNPGVAISFFNPETDFAMAKKLLKFADCLPSFNVPDYVKKSATGWTFAEQVVRVQERAIHEDK